MAGGASKRTRGKELHDLFREVFALHAALSGVMDEIHNQAGLSTSQHRIIRVLSGIGPATVPDMAAVLGVSRQFVQAVCNDLCSNGFLEFMDNPRHKRSKLALLTDSGRHAFRRARRKENKIIE
ncbi:MAG: MarR family transcriptional regulator, partial [Planctomycetes bacterium]|nr:MarR family transcriptional regulator [Planctomycetota bacterium]